MPKLSELSVSMVQAEVQLAGSRIKQAIWELHRYQAASWDLAMPLGGLTESFITVPPYI